jgi:hypothetical protein
MRKVYSYDEGEVLDGTPSQALIKASEDTAPDGAVYGMYNPASHVWDVLDKSLVEDYRRLGWRICEVYVE